MERLYFHRFKDIGEEALGIRHVHNGLFWKQIVPQYCHEVPSVKHAYIAFSAAYLNFHVSGKRPDPSSPPTEAESFVINQYKLALKNIAADCDGLPLRRRYGITMMCCVAFFCIEVLRGEWEQGLAHLANGLRMMSDLPEDVADILHNPAKWSQGLDTSYMRVAYMIKLLTRWEVSVSYLAADFQPFLTTKAFQSRQLDLHIPGTARSVEELQDIVDDFCQDANAFAYLARHGDGGHEYWVDPTHRLQYWALKQRSDNIAPLFREHREMHGNYQPGSREDIALNISLLNHRASSLTLDLLPFSGECDILSLAAEEDRAAELVRVAETIHDAHQHFVEANNSTRISLDSGVVPTLHVAARLCSNESIRDRLCGLIREWPGKESVWDGPVLRGMQVY